MATALRLHIKIGCDLKSTAKRIKLMRDYDFAKDNKDKNATFCRPCKLDFNRKKSDQLRHFEQEHERVVVKTELKYLCHICNQFSATIHCFNQHSCADMKILTADARDKILMDFSYTIFLSDECDRKIVNAISQDLDIPLRGDNTDNSDDKTDNSDNSA